MLKDGHSRTLTVCLLSPHPGLLATLQRLLASPDFRVRTARLKLGPGHDPEGLRLPQTSVYVVDASSSRPEIESLIEKIRDRFPRGRVLVVKETLKDEKLFPYVRAGAKGAVRYDDTRRDLARAVRVVGSGGFWISRTQLARFVDSLLVSRHNPLSRSEPGPLSRREREVLVAILQGLANKEIGARLNISERTVKFHVSNVLAKFGVQRRADLILKHYQVWPVAS